MARYRVLRDFGSHLGNHHRGEMISLPEEMPRGFAGFVERVAEPVPPVETKDLTPASGRANDAPADAGSPKAPTADAGPSPKEAGSLLPAADPEASSPSASEAPPEPEEPPTPAPRAEAGHYSDKALRSGQNRGRR